jgi:hypothetical protein
MYIVTPQNVKKSKIIAPYHQLEAEILSQKITLISELKKNIEIEKHIIGSKSLTVREKKDEV